MKHVKTYLVAGAFALALPGVALASGGNGTGGGTGTGGGRAPGNTASVFKPIVLKIHDPGAQDLARTRNGRLRKTDQDLTNEMATADFFGDGKTGLHVEMRTGALENGATPVNRMQAACTPIAMSLDASGQVQLTKNDAAARFVTDNDGEEWRNAMKPQVMPINGGKNMLLMFNYRPNGANNTRRYAKVLDAQCNEVPITNANGQARKQVLIMQKDNDDCDMHQNGVGPGENFSDVAGKSRIALWAGCNGNGRDDGWMNVINVQCQGGAAGASACQIQKEFDISLARREERSRGRCSTGTDPTTAICTWTEGNNQPQRDGTWIAAVDLAETGQNGEDAQTRLIWKQQFDGKKIDGVAVQQGNGNGNGNGNGDPNADPNAGNAGNAGAANPNAPGIRTYSVRMTQTRVMQEVAGNLQKTDMLILQAGDARGNNRNNKKGGTYRAMQMAVVEANRAGLNYVVPKTDVTDLLAGIDGTHLVQSEAMFGGGTNLIPGMSFLQGSHNGGGVIAPQFKGVGVDLANKKFLDLGTRSAGGSYDRALYSNYLGNNPGNQGRNYAGATLVKNPFANQPGQTTKYFIMHAMNGKSPETVDNAALKPASYISMAPIATTVDRGTHLLLAEENNDNNEKSGCTAVTGKAGYEGLFMLGLCLGLVRIARRRRA